MDFFRKLVIIIILSLTTYVLYRLLEKRNQIQRSTAEGFFSTSSSTELSNLKALYTGMKIGVKSVPSNSVSTQYPIKEYIVKSAYNCARSGSYISTNCIEWVLSRGCRFLDFEVYSIEGAPYVAYTTDATYTVITSYSEILLADALRCVVNNGFAGVAPNPQDPLFIQLRVKTNDDTLYNLIGMTVANVLGPRLYKGHVTMNTTFASLMGHVVLVYDKSQSPTYMDLERYPNCMDELDSDDKCFSLTKFINVEAGTDILRTYSNAIMFGQLFTPVTMSGSNEGTSTVSTWRIVTPDDPDSNTNINSLSAMELFGAQFTLQKYYKCDSQIKMYEQFFADNGSSFVPMVNVITYINNRDLS